MYDVLNALCYSSMGMLRTSDVFLDALLHAIDGPFQGRVGKRLLTEGIERSRNESNLGDFLESVIARQPGSGNLRQAGARGAWRTNALIIAGRKGCRRCAGGVAARGPKIICWKIISTGTRLFALYGIWRSGRPRKESCYSRREERAQVKPRFHWGRGTEHGRPR